MGQRRACAEADAGPTGRPTRHRPVHPPPHGSAPRAVPPRLCRGARPYDPPRTPSADLAPHRWCHRWGARCAHGVRGRLSSRSPSPARGSPRRSGPCLPVPRPACPSRALLARPAPCRPGPCLSVPGPACPVRALLPALHAGPPCLSVPCPARPSRWLRRLLPTPAATGCRVRPPSRGWRGGRQRTALLRTPLAHRSPPRPPQSAAVRCRERPPLCWARWPLQACRG